MRASNGRPRHEVDRERERIAARLRELETEIAELTTAPDNGLGVLVCTICDRPYADHRLTESCEGRPSYLAQEAS